MSVKFITQAAVIAAIYVVLVVIFNYISFGPVQFRIAEALTILPYFTPAAIPGLFVGCIIANILGGAIVWDVVFGSIATLIGAIGTYLLRKHKWLAPVPPIVANTIIVPFVLKFAYGSEGHVCNVLRYSWCWRDNRMRNHRHDTFICTYTSKTCNLR